MISIAGNFATASAAVSCMGVGEDIISECLAMHIVERVDDGMAWAQSIKSIQESQKNGRDLAAIALDATGALAWGKTCPVLLSAYHTGEKIGDTLEWGEAETIGYWES